MTQVEADAILAEAQRLFDERVAKLAADLAAFRELVEADKERSVTNQ